MSKLNLADDYDKIMHSISSDYKVPMGTHGSLGGITPAEVYSSKFSRAKPGSRSQMVIKPIKIEEKVFKGPNEGKDSDEEGKAAEEAILNQMQNELDLQESLAEDIKHFLDYQNVFESNNMENIKIQLNDKKPVTSNTKEAKRSKFKLSRTTNRQDMEFYDPNKIIEVSDEEMLLKIVGESSNVLGYRSKYENLQMKNLNENMTKWGIESLINKNYQAQRHDFIGNRPSKVRQAILNKIGK